MKYLALIIGCVIMDAIVPKSCSSAPRRTYDDDTTTVATDSLSNQVEELDSTFIVHNS